MMKNKVFFFAFMLLLTAVETSHAGVRDIGNGGDAVVCFKKDSAGNQVIQSVELLDYYEARTIFNWPVDLGEMTAPDSDGTEMALRAVERMSQRHPQTAYFYRKRIAEFFNDARIEYGIDLHEIDDANVTVTTDYKLEKNYLYLPKGCKLVQLAIRRDKSKVPDKKTFSINGELWDRMSPLHRAGLILHEIMYEDLLLSYEHALFPIYKQAPDSRHVRYMVAVFSHPTLYLQDDADYLRTIYTYASFIEDIVFVDLISSLTPEFTRLLPKTHDVELKVGNRTFLALRGSSFELYDNGTPKYIYLAKDTRIDLNTGSFIALGGSKLEFSPEGAILSAYLAQETKFTFKEGSTVTVMGNEKIWGVNPRRKTLFWPDLGPREFMIPPRAYSKQNLVILGPNLRRTQSQGLNFALDCKDPIPALAKARQNPEADVRDYCVVLHANGLPRRVRLIADEPMFDFEVVDQSGQIIELTKMLKEANEEARHLGAPLYRLPKFLEFDANGRAICPFIQKSTGQCLWLQRVTSFTGK